MVTLREAATLALEAICSCGPQQCEAAAALRTALAEPVQPFGYFRAEPFGWTDCAETDEGAVALYAAPPQSSINAELVEALRAIAAMSPYSNDAMEAIVLADGALAKVEASNGS